MISEFVVILAGLDLLLIMAVLLWSLPDIRRQFAGIKKTVWVLLLLVFLFGAFLRAVPPHHHMVFIDEYWTMEAAKNILFSGRSEMCEYLGYEEVRCVPYHKLIGTPFIFSLAFLVLGVNSYNAIYLCTILGSLSILLMFLLAYILFRREDAALYSSLLFATFPYYIMWSGSAATSTPAMFFMLLTLIFFLLYFRTKKQRVYLLAVLTLAYTIQVRIELISLLFLVPVMHLIFDSSLKKGIMECRLWRYWALFIPFFVSFLLQAANYVSALINVLGTYSPDIAYNIHLVVIHYNHIPAIIENTCPVLILIALSVLGAFSLKRCRNKRFPVFALVLFLTFLAINILVTFIASKIIMSIYVSVILLSAPGAVLISGLLKRVSGEYIAYAAVTALLMAMFFPYVYPHYTDSLIENAYIDAKVLETTVPEHIKKDVPDNCYIITKYPPVLSTTNLKATSIHTALSNPGAIENIYRKTGCVMFYEDMSCFHRRTREESGCVVFYQRNCIQETPIPECGDVKERYDAEKYIEYDLGEFTYTFYNISF